jgi:tripartite-type tricarboxylate transporter receptor subunit TctC
MTSHSQTQFSDAGLSRLGRSFMRKAALAATFGAACLAASAAEAQDFYKGKQINFIISSDVGGSYDVFARMLSRYLPKYIPGEPSIVAQNMAGAGGLRATNWLYTAAPKDGLTIGMINNTLAFDPLYGNKQAQFDAAKFNWLGTPSRETGLLIVWHTVPVNSLEDAQKREIILSASGSGSTPAFFARVLTNIFDLKTKIIPGYKSQTDGFLGMERGENDGNASPFWSSLTNNYPTWIPEKKIKVLVYYGAERVPEIPGPYVFDLIKDPEKKAIMEIAQAGLAMGRPVAAPPGVDAARVKILGDAFVSVFKDAAYIAECAKIKLDCSSPSSGAEMLEFVKKIYASPKSAVEKITAIYMEGQKG